MMIVISIQTIGRLLLTQFYKSPPPPPPPLFFFLNSSYTFSFLDAHAPHVRFVGLCLARHLFPAITDAATEVRCKRRRSRCAINLHAPRGPAVFARAGIGNTTAGVAREACQTLKHAAGQFCSIQQCRASHFSVNRTERERERERLCGYCVCLCQMHYVRIQPASQFLHTVEKLVANKMDGVKGNGG